MKACTKLRLSGAILQDGSMAMLIEVKGGRVKEEHRY